MSELCPRCKEPFGDTHWRWGDEIVCIDCWPGYNLCADERCAHYRCEHGEDDCGNCDCPCTGFKEGSKRRVVNCKEFAELKKSWGLDSQESAHNQTDPNSPTSAAEGEK